MSKSTPFLAVFVSVAVALPATTTESDPKNPTSAPTNGDDRPLVVADKAGEPEEIVVTGTPEDPFKAHNFEYMQLTYDARGKGSCLYRRGDYEEAFPYLLAAAKRGFKFAQARVSFLYQQGLGTPRDPEAAVGWLSVAAVGTTHPEIRNRFRGVWRRIPQPHLPHFERIVDGYRARYNSRLHGVNCDLAPKAGSHIHKLTCRFVDEAMFLDASAILEGRPPSTTPPDPYAGC